MPVFWFFIRNVNRNMSAIFLEENRSVIDRACNREFPSTLIYEISINTMFRKLSKFNAWGREQKRNIKCDHIYDIRFQQGSSDQAWPIHNAVWRLTSQTELKPSTHHERWPLNCCSVLCNRFLKQLKDITFLGKTDFRYFFIHFHLQLKNRRIF